MLKSRSRNLLSVVGSVRPMENKLIRILSCQNYFVQIKVLEVYWLKAVISLSTAYMFMMLTFFSWCTTCSSSAGIWILLRSTKNRTFMFRSPIRVSQIVIVCIIINSIPFFKHSRSISSKIIKLFFSVGPQCLWCITWQVCLEIGMWIC